MSLQPYYTEPFFSFSDINRFFDDAFGVFDRSSALRSRINEGTIERSSSFRPKIDVHENPEANLVTTTFELPGLKKEDISIDLQNNRLVVSGVTNVSDDREENGYVIKERHSGKFTRTVPLPSGTKPQHIKASMENGILTVTFPKTTDEEPTKRITIS
ncbi:hypothetical protein EW145_g2332 [Phellinidium pouzarii]|uniref:SHSP domain-containing protein n=1 Tax=Phellinidium pouzarii TaxID=167371 RepID=A0A4S4LBQ7_9AGAM|nr:hypothetical protein EW145_g2332 [Phellinidium pouzarii]